MNKFLIKEIRESAEYQYKDATEFVSRIEASEKIMSDLLAVSKVLRPIFPPSWNIVQVYFDIYKDVVLNKIGSYITHMDKHVESGQGLLLSMLMFG
jgi:hypothetical protein